MSISAKFLCQSGLLLACLLGVAGCGSPRYVSKNTDEGIIALPADNERNRKKAEKMMAAHFPDGYEIVHEYEEKVGETTYEDHHTHTHSAPGAYLAGYVDAKRDSKDHSASRPSYAAAMLSRSRHTRSQSTTLDKTEWRIRYRRKQAGPKPRGTETSIADIPSASH